MSTLTYMNIKGQSHSLTLVQGHSGSTFSIFFSWETDKPTETKLDLAPQWDRGTKFCSNGPGHMTQMAGMPISGKDMKKSSSLKLKGRWPWKFVLGIKSNFIRSFFRMGERKLFQTVQVTWPRWPPCQYMVKTLKYLLLWNQKADDLETWYVASGAQVLPINQVYSNDDRGWPLPILR